MKFAREAVPFVAPFWFLALALLILGWWWWGLFLVLLGLLILLFFRDPPRSFPGDGSSSSRDGDGDADPRETAILSAADGKVLTVDEGVEDPRLGPGTFRRIVTFLSVFDVHTQKVPSTGEVLFSETGSGRKVAAFRDDAGEVNEQHMTVIRRPDGDLVAVRQVVGLVARRIVCYLQQGQRVNRGQSLGLIKFGSRVDVYVPESYQVAVSAGDRLKNGETVVAHAPVAGP